MFSGMTIDRGRDCGGHVHETGLVPYLHPKPTEILRKFGPSGRKGDLGQKPEGMEKCWIFGCTLQCLLGGIGDGHCYFANARAKPQLIDDLVPLPRLWQNAQSDVARLGLPCVEACGSGGGQASRK